MVLLPQTAEIRTIPKSLPRSFQNNFKCLFFKRLYQIDEILKYIFHIYVIIQISHQGNILTLNLLQLQHYQTICCRF